MDGAPACPFVAFGDDRDGRATSPTTAIDASPKSPPAPRALAHQEAYCLSSAFPVCPTFQDWARREAAHARGGGERAETAPSAVATSAGPAAAASAAAGASAASAASEASEPGMLDGTGAPDPAGQRPSDGEVPVRRNPPRDWAAPPPWANSSSGTARPPSSGPPPEVVAAEFLAARSGAQGQGLAGSPADRLAGGPPPASGPSAGGPTPGVAGAAAAGAAVGAAASAPPASGHDAPAVAADDDLRGLVQTRPPSPPTSPASHPAEGYPPATRTGKRPAVSSTRPTGDTIPGPPWERMRRYEAYPTIRTRGGLSGLPRIAVLVGALGVAALALFMLPALLGIGGGAPADSRGPSLSPGAAASDNASPTPVPAPSAQIYVIKSGDTLSKVARRSG